MESLRWHHLSPKEFHQLQEYASYSSKKLKDVVPEFEKGGALSQWRFQEPETEQKLSWDCFRKFLEIYLEADVPETLSKHLFLFFAKRSWTHCQPDPSKSSGSVQNISHVREKSSSSSPNHSSSRSSSKKSTISVSTAGGAVLSPVSDTSLKQRSKLTSIDSILVPLKEIVCYLSMLESGSPEEKLEFMFRLYDTDSNGYLDSSEMESIINQMMQVATYLQWDTVELKPILEEMMQEIDYDKDGTVSLEEWKRGGMTTIPLLVLLGLDCNVRENGTHLWKLKHFKKTAFCNLCHGRLVRWGTQGLSCTVCKYTVHERCVQRAPNNCINTYVKSRKENQTQTHHWVEGNCEGKCARCRKKVKSFNTERCDFTGQRCRWCRSIIHTSCASLWTKECNFGPLAYHVLPPNSILPLVLDRPKVERSASLSRKGSAGSRPLPTHSTSFQIVPPPSSRPLLVFVNPKSGGKQGERIYAKFQYLLNPRQVYNLNNGGPEPGLSMFSALGANLNVLCCGGDGTVGWVLESIDKLELDEGPSIAILPLGTGNDLARCLNWGGGTLKELTLVFTRSTKDSQ